MSLLINALIELPQFGSFVQCVRWEIATFRFSKAVWHWHLTILWWILMHWIYSHRIFFFLCHTLTVFTVKNWNITFRQALCWRQEQKIPVQKLVRVKEFTRNRWQELIDDPQRQTRKTDNRGNIKTGEVKQLINKVEKKKIRIESLGLPV